MKRLIILSLCLLSCLVLADRRGQLMNIRPASSGGAFPSPPTSGQPGIWLDVIEQVTNGVSDFTKLANFTNYGVLGGTLYTSQDCLAPPGSSPTNIFYRSIEGGVISGVSDCSDTSIQWTNGANNTEQYFQTNYGTFAIRINQANSDHSPGIIQTGSTPPRTGSDYEYDQMLTGTWYFDWNADRISSTAPIGSTNAWMNLVYVKSNDLMQIWIAGTNWLQASGKTSSLTSTSSAAGPLLLLQGVHHTNFLAKRVLAWSYGLTPLEISNLNLWMTAMP